MFELLMLATLAVLFLLALGRRNGAAVLVVAVLALPALALAQSLDGNTVVTLLPVSDRAKANVAWAWLGVFYLAGFLKRWIPSHTIVGKGLDFITQDTRPPSIPAKLP